MQNTASFRITYAGPSLDNHEMNVKDLAPALLAIGELLETANELINSDRTKVAVNIKAPPHAGSIGIDFSVVQSLTSSTISIFSGNEATAAANILQILGINGLALAPIGLIKFIKWLKNRRIKNIITLENGNLKIELVDDDHAEIIKKVLDLYQNIKVRKSLQSVITDPLTKNGIEEVKFDITGKTKEQEENKITKIDANLYLVPQTEQEIIDDVEVEMNLQIVSISFQEGNKWKFTDGTITFFADIIDHDFISKVQKNQTAFAKDDILKVITHKKQYLTQEGMKSDYIIKKIIDHRSSAVQIKLPLSEPGQN